MGGLAGASEGLAGASGGLAGGSGGLVRAFGGWAGALGGLVAASRLSGCPTALGKGQMLLFTCQMVVNRNELFFSLLHNFGVSGSILKKFRCISIRKILSVQWRLLRLAIGNILGMGIF